MAEREWEQLSLDEKLTELGFERGEPKPKGFPPLTLEQQLDPTEATRIHAALDQLMDCGGMLAEIEAMVKPAATGNPTGDELNICVAIHELVVSEEE